MKKLLPLLVLATYATVAIVVGIYRPQHLEVAMILGMVLFGPTWFILEQKLDKMRPPPPPRPSWEELEDTSEPADVVDGSPTLGAESWPVLRRDFPQG